MQQGSEQQPAIFIIFGATGDLSQEKLFPALTSLYAQGELPTGFRIIGSSRQEWTDRDFRDFLRNEVLDNTDVSEELFTEFLQSVHFEPGDVTKQDSFDRLYERIQTIDNKLGVCSDKLFYLAVSPHLFTDIVDNFSASRLMSLCDNSDSWTRILVEKPYGVDLQTAKALDDKLCSVFAADQLFRIDHYLGKSALQNIMAVRFFNGLFAGSWNKDHIESVHIQLLEPNKVTGRGSFYDEIGAFRDVGQNHLLQMLALLTMEPPAELTAEEIRGHRADLLSDLNCFADSQRVSDNLVLGQYDGFTQEKGVATDSSTETYFLLKTQINNDRWEGVPVFLESGKALAEKSVRAEVTFSSPLNPDTTANSISKGSRLTMAFQPEPHFSLDMLVNTDDLGFSLERQQAAFAYQSDTDLPDAYESVLSRAIAGDQMIFPNREEIDASWQFTMPVVNNRTATELHSYQPGTKGPEARNALLGF